MTKRITAIILALLLLLSAMPALAASKCPKCGKSTFSCCDKVRGWCDEPGHEYWACSNCNYNTTKELKPLGHDWKYSYTKKPTCTTPGEGSRTCQRCGKNERGTFDAAGHDFRWTVIDATCTQEGSRKGVCERCGHTWEGEIPAKGHSWTNWAVITEAAPNQLGCRERHCSVCLISEKEFFSINGSYLFINKSAVNYDGKTPFSAGDTIEYAVTVKNGSDHYLYDVEVTDPLKGGNEDAVVGLEPVFGPDEVLTWSFKYTVSADDAKNGFVVNTARVDWAEMTDAKGWNGEPAYEYGFAYSNEVTVPVEPAASTPAVDVSKRVFDDPKNGEYYVEGENVRFAVDIVNGTESTLILASVTDYSTDSGIIGTAHPDFSLPAGGEGTVVIGYQVTNADVSRGYMTDYAVVEAYPEGGKPSEAAAYKSNEVTINFGSSPEPEPEEIILFEKYLTDSPANGQYFLEGETARISVDVVNCTERAIVIADIEDINIDTGASFSIGGADTALPAERVSCEFDYVITKEDAQRGSAMDRAVVTWYYEDTPDDVRTDETDALIILCGEGGSVTVTKALAGADSQVFKPGDTAEFTITVTNGSGRFIPSIVLRDEIDDTGESFIICKISGLAPGASETVGAAYTVQPDDALRGSVTDTVSAWVQYDEENPEDSEDITSNSVTINCAGSAVSASLYKFIGNTPQYSPAFFTEGEIINFCFYFYNDSDELLEDVVIYDGFIGDSLDIGPIEPHDMGMADFFHTVEYADCENGSFYNLGYAEAVDAQGNKIHVESNPVTAVCGFLPEPDVSIAVKKQVISSPLNGSAYTPGETVTCLVNVTNTGEAPVYDLNAVDVIYLPDGPLEISDYAAGPLEPGRNISFTFSYTLSFEDCLAGMIYDNAFIDFAADNDKGGIEYSNECGIPTETGIAQATEAPVLIKYEISTPKNSKGGYDGYYTEGENVSFIVVLYNGTSAALSDITVYDILSDLPAGIIIQQDALGAGEFVPAYVDYEVTAFDVEPMGSVTNIAWGTVMTAGRESITLTSNEVTVPCGQAGEPAPYIGSSCVKTLAACGNGSELVRTDLCGWHHSLELAALSMDDPEEIAAMWERCVKTMYTSALSATGCEAFAAERDIFFAEIDALKRLLDEDDCHTIIALLRERATELCYEQSRRVRADNPLKPADVNAFPASCANRCVLDIMTGTYAWYQTTATAASGHMLTDTAAQKLISASAGDAKLTAAALEKAEALWQNALSGEYAAIIRVNPAFAEDMALFMPALEARRATLSAVYPDDADMVNALIIREIRNRVILLCERVI